MLPDIMNDFYYLVHKYDYFVLQRFRGFRELFDIIKNEAFESYPGAMKTSHLLPIKYSFKIFGKSGIRRGDTFVIKGIPEKYEKNGFFQVVQVEHDIQDSKWVTEVVGQYRQQVSK